MLAADGSHLARTKETRSTLTGEMTILADMEKRYEGLSAGAKGILQKRLAESGDPGYIEEAKKVGVSVQEGAGDTGSMILTSVEPAKELTLAVPAIALALKERKRRKIFSRLYPSDKAEDHAADIVVHDELLEADAAFEIEHSWT